MEDDVANWKADVGEGLHEEITGDELRIRDDLDPERGNERKASVDLSTFENEQENGENEWTIVQGKCPICLKSLLHGVLIKECLHEFCCACISHWAHHLLSRKVPVKCPICRVSFQLVIANLRSEDDYDVVDVLDPSVNMKSDLRDRRLIYRRRQSNLTTEQGMVTTWTPIIKTITQGKTWIDRELHAILGEDFDISLLMQIITPYINKVHSYCMKQHDPKRLKSSHHPYDLLCQALEDFLDKDTHLFVQEMAKFMGSRLNIEAYDKNAVISPVDVPS